MTDIKTNIIDYIPKGWIPLENDYPVWKGRDHADAKDLEEYVVDSNLEIKILMDDRFNDDKELNKKFTTYSSPNGIKVGKVMNLIFNFLVENIDKDNRDNLALAGFRFDPDKLEVHPHTDS